MGWISVKDRLPKIDGQYLVYTECGDMFNAEFDRDCGEFGNWHGYYHPDWDKYEGITHWMPLPELPKDGE